MTLSPPDHHSERPLAQHNHPLDIHHRQGRKSDWARCTIYHIGTTTVSNDTLTGMAYLQLKSLLV